MVLDPVGMAWYLDGMETRMPGYIPKTWDLPQSIRRRLGDQVGRQRLMDEDGHLLLLLHHPPRPEDDALRSPSVFWCSAAGEWKSAPGAGGLSALQELIASYKTAVFQLDEVVDAAREPLAYFQVLRAVNPLLRSSRSLLGVMEHARKARPDERRLIVLRDEAVEIERCADLLANDAKAGMEFTLAESGQQQAAEARRTTIEARRLNRLVAFFFPLATLVAIFGMNPPFDILSMRGFWLVIGLGVLCGLVTRAIIGGGDSAGPGQPPRER
jgi:hypothetical protein